MRRRFIAVLALIAFALVLAPPAAAGGGCRWESDGFSEAASSAPEVTAHIAECRYDPTTLYIQPGTTVTWLNKDYVPHSVTGSFLTLHGDKYLEKGESASVTFEEEGVFAYYCLLHPGMAASVVVGDPIDGERKDLKDQVGPMSGADEQPPSGTTETTESFPLATSIGAIALVGIAGTALLVRKRRRAVPLPGALP